MAIGLTVARIPAAATRLRRVSAAFGVTGPDLEASNSVIPDEPPT
jgi:hypothetical protein